MSDADTAPSPIRVVVVDDQAIVRDGIRTVLDLLPDVDVVGEAADGERAVALVAETGPDVALLDLLPDVDVVGEAADGERAVALVAETGPDVALLDLRMPVLDGAAATARIAAEHPSTAVLILTTYADDASIMGALRAGARGYLTKDAGREELAAAIRAVHRGQTTLAPEVSARLIGGLAAPAAEEPPGLRARYPELTTREAEVLELVAEGLANPEIATRLFVSTATVKTHINAIFAKLGTRTRAETIARVGSR